MVLEHLIKTGYGVTKAARLLNETLMQTFYSAHHSYLSHLHVGSHLTCHWFLFES
jgi:hypothetical protein